MKDGGVGEEDNKSSPLSTAVRADDAHPRGHVQAEIDPLEEPGQLGAVLEVDVLDLHDGGRDDGHLRRGGVGEEGGVRGEGRRVRGGG